LNDAAYRVYIPITRMNVVDNLNSV
jgi:hypothetical protein